MFARILIKKNQKIVHRINLFEKHLDLTIKIDYLIIKKLKIDIVSFLMRHNTISRLISCTGYLIRHFFVRVV